MMGRNISNVVVGGRGVSTMTSLPVEASSTTSIAVPPTPTASTGGGGGGGGGPTSSPLLFFVALGFGVVFTNLWYVREHPNQTDLKLCNC
jgi:hypothetical protein